jgi:flagellar protein FlaG
MNIEQLTQSILKSGATPAHSQTGKMRAAEVVAAGQPATPPPEKPVVTAEKVRAAAEQIDSYLKSTGRNLDIRVDQDTGQTVVTVRDAATGDVIRQIPNEEALQLAKSLGASAPSPVILDQTA